MVKNETDRNNREYAFYYYNDHLGSAAYLTDDCGQVTQTLNYLPYGEDWVDIQNNLDPRLGQYTFNGKEKDWESGFHYYGARYYWSEVLTGWLSVDPMMDKYPSISPYAYCVWNPVKLVDPDGQKIRTIDAYSRKQVRRYLKEQFGSSRAFRFNNGYLTINEKKFKRLSEKASNDQKMLLEGLREAIDADATALVSVQSCNSEFSFTWQYSINGEIYDGELSMNLKENSGATATTPLMGTTLYPIAINDKGINQGNSLTTDYYDENGNPLTTTSTASTVFMHEVLDEFLNVGQKGTVSPSSPNREKVFYQNAALRNIGLLERNGADHDY